MQPTADATTPGASEMIAQFIPLTILSLIYAVVVFVIARKRGVNPWPWAIGTAFPLIGVIIIGPAFLLMSFLSVFDRLNALEGQKAAT